MSRAFRDPGPQDVAKMCSTTFFSVLPPALKVVVMLGVTDSYISGCRQLFGRLRDAKSIKPVAHADSQVIWIHVIHPSPGAQNHYKDWLTGTGTKLSQKRQYAKAALRERGLQLAALDLGHTATLRRAVVGENRAQHPDSTERRQNMVTERELFGVFDRAGFALLAVQQGR